MKQAGTMLHSLVGSGIPKAETIQKFQGLLQKILMVNLSFKFLHKFVLEVIGNWKKQAS